MKLKLLLSALIFFAITISYADTTGYPPGARTQIPKSLDQTYLGASVGYTDIPYSNIDLINLFMLLKYLNLYDLHIRIDKDLFFSLFFRNGI